MKRRAARKHAWFWLHMAVNISGVGLVIAAFAIATRWVVHLAVTLTMPARHWVVKHCGKCWAPHMVCTTHTLCL